MNEATSRSRYFYHGKEMENQPQHLYNKKTLKLAFDRFGPRTLALNQQTGYSQPFTPRSQEGGSLYGQSNFLPSVPKTPVERNAISLYGMTQFNFKSPNTRVKDNSELDSLNDGSKVKINREQVITDNVRPIFMGKRLQQRVNGLLYKDMIKNQKDFDSSDQCSQHDHSKHTSSGDCSMSSTDVLEQKINQESNPLYQNEKTNKGQQRRMTTFQNQGGVRQSQEQVSHMMQANYQRAKRIEQERQTVIYRNQFHQTMSTNNQKFEQINKQYLEEENDMVCEPEIYKYITDTTQFKQRIQKMVENKLYTEDTQQTTQEDQLSDCSSINLDEIGQNGLIRKYLRQEINKKKDQAKDLNHDEIQEQNAIKTQKHSTKKVDQKLYKINLQTSRATPRKFVTGDVGYEILKQIGEKQIKTGLKIEEIKASEFKEFENPERDQKKFYFESHRTRKGTKKLFNIQKKTQIENSSVTKNYKIFDELEQKKEFYKLAKENRKIHQHAGDQKFIQSCMQMGVTPLPAFCKSKNLVQKVLMPIQENKDPLVAALAQARLGDAQNTLQLFQYYLSENIAKALGKQLKDQCDDFQTSKNKVLMLDDNGLTDRGLSYILEGLYYQKLLESLNITKNEIGAASLAVFEKIFERMQIQELRLTQIKFSHTKFIGQTMKIVSKSRHPSLLALKLNDINLQDKHVFESLVEILSQNKLLTDINLESTGLLSLQMQQVTDVIKTQNKNLKWLNLANNPIQLKFEEANLELVTNLCEIITAGSVQHLNLTGLSFDKSKLLAITQSVTVSSLLGLHLSNHECFDDQSFKAEMSTILSFNYQQSQVLKELKREHNTKATKLVRKGSNEWMFNNIESKEVSITNNFQYQLEVQKQRQINQFTNFNHKNELIIQNFVIQRVIGHPELNYESLLKNQCEAQNIISTDKWQIIDHNEKSSSCQISKNCCYMCEKCPYTIFFYQRESRQEHFVQITNSKDVKKIKDTFFISKATGNLFTADDNDILLTGGFVDWDVIKMKTVENYGMQIDQSFHEQKEEEKTAAKKRRDLTRKGIYPDEEDIKFGAQQIGPFKQTRDVIKQQIKEIREKEANKYTTIFNDFEKNTSWQDQLKNNLKIQDDMCFLNTPDFNKRLAVTSKINIADITNSQIYIYSDYCVKPGKYTAIVYDCMDDTIWFKTVVVGLRKTQIVEANIKQTKFADRPVKEVCKIKFPKYKYFRDFDIDVEQMPKELKFELDEFLESHFNELLKEQEQLSRQQSPTKLKEEEEDEQPIEEPVKKPDKEQLLLMKQEQIEENKKERQNYLSMLSEIYGLLTFIFFQFSRTSSYPYINQQDFQNVLKMMKMSTDNVSEYFEGEYFSSELEFFKIFVRMYSCSDLSRNLRDLVMPRVGEYLWDHFYDKKIWEHDNRQVMNLMFMNIDLLQHLHKALKRIPDKVSGFHGILEQHCPEEDWEAYQNITNKDYQSFIYKSKLQVTQTLTPGIKNTDYLKLQKQGQDVNCEMSFVEFMQFFIIMSMIQMTNYDFDPNRKEQKKFKIGERLKCPIDKVHKFMTFFRDNIPLSVPKIEGYLEPGKETYQKTAKQRNSRQVLSRSLSKNLQAARTFKQLLYDDRRMEILKKLNLKIQAIVTALPKGTVIPIQDEEEPHPHMRNLFVNWNSLNPLLNKELHNEEQNYFIYTDQSSAEDEDKNTDSDDSFSD